MFGQNFHGWMVRTFPKKITTFRFFSISCKSIFWCTISSLPIAVIKILSKNCRLIILFKLLIVLTALMLKRSSQKIFKSNKTSERTSYTAKQRIFMFQLPPFILVYFWTITLLKHLLNDNVLSRQHTLINAKSRIKLLLKLSVYICFGAFRQTPPFIRNKLKVVSVALSSPRDETIFRLSERLFLSTWSSRASSWQIQ